MNERERKAKRMEDCINFLHYVWVNIEEAQRQKFIEEYKQINPETELFDIFP